MTVEFLNIRPLGAKIYTDEGCAQVLFLESDKDDVLGISCKGTCGKYQE